MTTPRSRALIFIALAIASLVGAGGYVYSARARGTGRVLVPAIAAKDPAALAAIRRESHIAFRSMAPGADYGALSFVRLDAPDGARTATTLPCLRVYASGGTALCLSTSSDMSRPYPAFVLDDTLAVRHAFNAPGVPSRVRVSRDGAMAGYTVFSGRDSYLATGFSTRTRLVEAGSGKALAYLEEWEASREGRPFSSADFNYWGITFSPDPNRFYATLGTGGHTYLVEGDVARRHLTVAYDGVECPSLSPDGRRIAFKKKMPGPQVWRPAVLDLATMQEVVLAEPRDVDDQIEWLDERHILYAIREAPARGTPRRANIWMLAADGSGAPALLLPDAESPAVVRR